MASTVFSIDRHTSIWGYYSRSHGGLLSTISYLLLYWAYVSNIDHPKIHIRLLLIAASLISLYGILEHFGYSPSCLILQGSFSTDCWVQDVQKRVFATLGQPNWLAAWLVAIFPLSVFCFLENSKASLSRNICFSEFWRLLIFILPFLIFISLIFTKSRSGIGGFGIGFVVFWLFLLATKNVRQRIGFLKIFGLFTFFILLISLLFGTPWTPSLIKPSTQETQISKEGPSGGTSLEQGGSETWEIRKVVWRGALDIWRAYPIFGSGVETFAFSYYNFRPVEHNQTTEWDFLYNKAHNEYLNFLSTTGAVGLGTYLLIIIVFTSWTVAKFGSSEKYILLKIAVFAGFVSILVTNFFGFSTVSVALLFFLFPAIAAVEQTTKNTQHRNIAVLSLRHWIFLIFVLCSMSYVLLRVVGLWFADYFYTKSSQSDKNGFLTSAVKSIDTAITLKPNEPLYYDKLAQITANISITFNDKKDILSANKAAQLSLDSSNYALSISPRSLNLLKSRAIILYELTNVDQKYLTQAIPFLETAVRLAPTDPKVRYNLGVLYNRLGNNKKAEEILLEAIQLKPDFYDARLGLAKLYHQKNVE